MKKILLFALLLLSFKSIAQIVNIPDPIFKAMLLSANYQTGTASTYYQPYYDPAICSGGSGNDIVTVPPSVIIDTNGNGEIEVIEAQIITKLFLYGYVGNEITDLTGIEAFVNLQSLTCRNNSLTSLNLSQNGALMYLDCSNNPISNFNALLYPFLYHLNCTGTLISTIVLPPNCSIKTLECGGSSLTSLNLAQGTNLLHLECHYASITSIDATQNTNLKSLVASYVPNLSSINITQNINLKSLRISGCPVTNLTTAGNPNLCILYLESLPITTLNTSQNQLLSQITVNNCQISVLDFSYNTTMGKTVCINNPLLTYLNIKNGVTQFYYSGSQFNGNNNLQFVCADDGEIQLVQNSVDPAVTVNSYCSFVPGGNYNTISGLVRFDYNSNGCDVLDIPQSNIRVNINDGTTTGTSFTTTNGNYSFFTLTGMFAITPNIENPTWFNFSPTNSNFGFANTNNNSATQNFCISANGIHPDVEIVIVPITPARPGFDATYKIIYKNKGNQTISGTIGFNFDDSILDYVSSTIIPTTQNTGLLNWNYNNLLPFESRNFTVTLNVNGPTETPPVNNGNILNYSVTVNPIAGDEIATDNTFLLNQLVVGSLDPNDKTCLEGNIVSPVKIGDYLHYNINFENTGTAAATFIVVKDIIDISKFDINSLQIMNSSHPMTTRITGNKVEFIFQNINLGAGQHGNVTFKIKTINTLVTGNTVTNNASIYFDYNFPVVTNIASTTFQSLSNSVFETDNSISVSPNPASSIINIQSNATIKSIQLFDIQGRLLQTSLENNTNAVIDISQKPNGIYFLKITSDKGSKVAKIVKE